jgi:hypothetical protein
VTSAYAGWMRPSRSSSKLIKGRESTGEGRGLRTKNGFAEPRVDRGTVTKYALKRRPQHLEIKQAFRNIKDNADDRAPEPGPAKN